LRRIKGREFRDEIDPRGYGKVRPLFLGQQGRFPPLDVVPAHDGRHDRVRGKFPGFLQMQGVPVVKGVVFDDKARGFHVSSRRRLLYGFIIAYFSSFVDEFFQIKSRSLSKNRLM